MENTRSFAAIVAARSLSVALAVAAICIFTQKPWAALGLIAGALVGLAYLFHIARSFNRLVKGGGRYLPLLTLESVVRVLLAGAAPVVIIGRNSVLGYFAYLAGFVAPLAVAILTYQQQIQAESAKTGATT
jgi:hypothetical protein